MGHHIRMILKRQLVSNNNKSLEGTLIAQNLDNVINNYKPLDVECWDLDVSSPQSLVYYYGTY